MLRLVGGVLAGYVLMAVLTFVVGSVLGESLAVSLALSFPYGICGGMLAAHIAAEREIAAGISLAVLSILMGALTWYLAPNPNLDWVALAASLAGGAVYGSYLQKKRRIKNEPRKKRKSKLVK